MLMQLHTMEECCTRHGTTNMTLSTARQQQLCNSGPTGCPRVSPHQPTEEASAPWHSPGCTLELMLPARRWEGPKSQTELRDLLISGLAEAKVYREGGDCQLASLVFSSL